MNSASIKKILLESKNICKLLYVHTTEYYSAIKRNELLIHATAWINLKIIMLSERSQTKEYTLYDSIFHKT